MSELLGQPENNNRTVWPDAVEQFAEAVKAMLLAYAQEYRRRNAPRPDRIDEFLKACVDTEPRLLSELQLIGIQHGFMKTEVREYLQRLTADGRVISKGRPITYKAKREAPLEPPKPTVDHLREFVLHCLTRDPELLSVIELRAKAVFNLSARKVAGYISAGVEQGLIVKLPAIPGQSKDRYSIPETTLPKVS